MAFQKCPVCEGSGKSTTEFGSTCHVCQGYGIINELNGQPPKKAVVTTNTTYDESFGIFIDYYAKTKKIPRPDWDEVYSQQCREGECKCPYTQKCVPIKTEE